MISKSLVAASSKPIILAILNREESYGYQIIQKIKSISKGKLEWSDGMLYPLLNRLEKEEMIQGQWKLSENGRHRKYYTITEKGRNTLSEEIEQWLSVHETLYALTN